VVERCQSGNKLYCGGGSSFLDAFQEELDSWLDELAEIVPVQLLVIAEEKVRSGGGQQWVKFLKRVKVFVRKPYSGKLYLQSIGNLPANVDGINGNATGT